MDIRSQYLLDKKLDYYQVPKHYQNTNGNKQKLSLKNKKLKKLSIFDQIIKIYEKFPGPAKYIINPQQKLNKKRLAKNIEQQKKKQKQSYLDPLLKRSKSLPAVGKYEVLENKKIRPLCKFLSNKDNFPVFRPTLFDSINKDSLTTCPGSYQIKQSIEKTLQKSPRYSIAPQPKKEKSLPKIPGPQQYNPVPSSYMTFQSRSLSSLSQNKNCTFGSRKQQKIKQKSPGPAYNLITSWGVKKPFSNQFNIYKSISNLKQGVYH